ncbi:MAG: HK97 family phage prohead protease [Vallitalea sp.]|jgi:HK97 family phage prohead protease|nr:HK97 family phage prohead protease [Vallitalea sp.]
MKLEIRNDSVVVEGYVNALCRDSKILIDKTGKKFVEQVLPKTFERALERNPVDILLNHDKNIKLGDTTTNLKLKEDNIGLYARAEIMDSDVITRARNGELKGWSFGFCKKKDRREPTNMEGIERRFLEDITLKEVSIIAGNQAPCYSGTSIETRSENDEILELRSFDGEVEVIDNTITEEKIEEKQEDRSFMIELEKQKIEILKLKCRC